MSLPVSVHYAVGDKGPDFVAEAYEPDGSNKDLSGAASITFSIYDLEAEAYIVEANATGVTLVGTQQFKRVLQTTDTAAELNNCVAWFSYELSSKPETTYAVGFRVSQPWKRRMR